MFRRHIALLLPLAALAQPALAADNNLEIDTAVSVIHTDNLDRSLAGEASAVVIAPGASVRYLRESGAAAYRVDAAVSARKYTGDATGSDLLGRFNGLGVFELVPERASIFVMDRYDQVASTSYEGLRPANREGVNFIGFGPQLAMPVGSAMALEFAAILGRSDYEESDAGANRWAAQLALVRRLSDRRELSFNIEQSSTKFRDAAGSPSLVSRGAFARFDTTARRFSAALEAGYNRVDNEATVESGARGSASVTWRVGAFSELSLEATHGFLDPINSFLLEQGLLERGVFNFDRDLLVVDDFGRTTTVAAVARIVRPRTTFSIDALYGKERFLTQQASDRKVQGTTFFVMRELGVRTSFRVGGAMYRERNESSLEETKFRSANVALDYRGGRRWEFSVSAQHFQLDRGLGFAKETRLSLQLSYALKESAMPEAPPRLLRQRMSTNLLDLGRIDPAAE